MTTHLHHKPQWETIWTTQGQYSSLRLDDLWAYWQNNPKHRDEIGVIANGSFVYVLGTKDHLKIGTTNLLWDRLKNLQSANPVPLCLEVVLQSTDGDGPKLESDLHRLFTQLRIHGEWFKREGELDDWVSCFRSWSDWPRITTQTVQGRSPGNREYVTNHQNSAQVRPTIKRIREACDLLLHQYQQVCEDNNVMGWPGMVVEIKEFLGRVRRTKQNVKCLRSHNEQE